MAERTTSTPRFPFPPPLGSRWQQVSEFPPSDPNDPDDEWTEEVEYVTFDFGHSHAPSPISSYSGFQVLGLNTPHPFLKIGDQVYRGEYESLVGTELIMRPVSAAENGKQTNQQRSGTEEQGEEGAEGQGGEEEDEEDGGAEEDDGGEGKVQKTSYEPLAHSRARIRWVPVTLTEAEGGAKESDSSSPEGAMGTDPKTKKRPGAGAGGRHWASHWTKFTPRTNRSKTKTDPPPQPEPEPHSQPEPPPAP
ncbi:hypothetical protein PCANC_03748 [Puccinia coronata f. sp. avenae]|uniref:Transcription factor TFIIIC triple barrel domain-containing protein n=1 Tax=Puccinia coronata f. sp. avenae TaxID=200324 RepID=A0A2N5VVA3_9BASI|nr:hypothetical protein PCANC_03748 [Puccinia coronata f. sp. avenae]